MLISGEGVGFIRSLKCLWVGVRFRLAVLFKFTAGGVDNWLQHKPTNL